MGKIMQWLEDKFLPLAVKMSNIRYLVALRDGFIAVMPISMFGALNVMVKEILLTNTSLFGETLNKWSFYAENIQPFFDSVALPISNQIWWGSLALGIVFTVFTISYKLAEFDKQDALTAGVLSVVAYFTLLPQSAGPDAAWGTISWTSFNSEAIFTGIMVAIVSTELFMFITKKGWIIKMPDQVPPAVSRAFSAVIPAAVVLFTFGVFSYLTLNVMGTTLKDIINTAIQIPLTSLGQSPLTMIFLTLVAQVLWFFGLHGSLIIGPILDTMYSASLSQNAEAVLVHGIQAPNAITRSIIDLYGMAGGSGATLALIIAIFMVSKRAEYRSLAKLSLMPGIFQINEPIIYGLPIVLNPIMAIPFILVPPVMVAIGWFFTEVIPFAGRVYIAPPWVVPPVLNTFLATGGSLSATFLSLVTLGLSVAFYLPFVMLANKMD
ncbi:PTS sugar transporter subunit IIC [Erysipelothrix sp. HDW6C]|uniref:PTS sugar transporter subunit IIC n=1 Tax=Erysipelothrix sp. HDW6C TaxID=2714930 RepID=UPI00140B96B4|nr:PTS transporter subunit EIIC [Erysipelothrix sp. HDW6C]QIK68893.1 PTS sugar transporter subunit IIC [Erysipelothrix sp. HDW6C]